MSGPLSRDPITRETWRVNGIDLAVTVAGAGPVVVLAHGFPDLALTWRHQIPALVAGGYRVIAPDMRGYGASASPEDTSAYDSAIVGADLIGLLDREGVARAHFVGHDWGAASVWPLGVTHPDRVASLTGISVPYALPAPVAPTEVFRQRLGDDFYMLRFQVQGEAEDLLGRDVRRSLLAIYAGVPELIDDHADIAAPTWLAAETLEAGIREFERTGFRGGLNYYRNIDENWRIARDRPECIIAAPSLFLTGADDPLTTVMSAARAARGFERLRTEVLPGAHWVHHQSPDRVNELLLEHVREAA